MLCFVAIWLPFVPVFIRRGCGADLVINIALDLLGWLPGVLRRWPLSILDCIADRADGKANKA